MPKVEISTHYQTQRCKFDVPANYFHIHFGYKDRCQIIIRLEEDNLVYLNHYNDTVSLGEPKSQVVTIPFDLFEKHFRDIVRFFQGKLHEKQTIE